MTIKELKEHIENMPDEAEALFALWGPTDKYNYFTIRKSKNIVSKIDIGGSVVVIGKANDCRADMMLEKSDGVFSY